MIKNYPAGIYLQVKMVVFQDDTFLQPRANLLQKCRSLFTAGIPQNKCVIGISHTINCFICIHHVNKPVCKNLLNPVAVICSVQYIDIIHMINFNFQNSYFSSLLNIIHNIFFKFDLTIKIRQRINFRNHILIPKQNNKISVFALL